MRPGRTWLAAAATMSFAASALHIGCILGGADWYRFFGAGEQMARLDEAGSLRPAALTFVIAAILAGWGLFALSAAGMTSRVPLLRTGLLAIIVVLFARTALFFVPSTWDPDDTVEFMAVSSAIVAMMGIIFAIGTLKSWPLLRTLPR